MALSFLAGASQAIQLILSCLLGASQAVHMVLSSTFSDLSCSSKLGNLGCSCYQVQWGSQRITRIKHQSQNQLYQTNVLKYIKENETRKEKEKFIIHPIHDPLNKPTILPKISIHHPYT